MRGPAARRAAVTTLATLAYNIESPYLLQQRYLMLRCGGRERRRICQYHRNSISTFPLRGGAARCRLKCDT